MSDPTIQSDQTMGGSPGGGTGAPPPQPGTLVPVTADATREYAAATGVAYYGNYWRSLTWAFDDVTTEFGADTYDRMLRDPQVIACVNALKAGILEDGAMLSPAVTDSDDPTYARAVALTEECQHMLDDLQPSLDDTLWDLLDALALGNKVAEIIWTEDMTTIRAIKVKPREAVAFVTDVYNNLVGLLARIPGIGVPVQAGTFIISTTPPYNILPREKFAVLTFRPKDNDPRGRSILRPAYNAWWLKMQTWPQYLKFLVQFGTPSLIGYVGPNAQTYQATGAQQKSPEQIMADTLVQFQNGSVAVFESGAKVEPINVAGAGVGAFIQAFDLYDRQITTAILHQTLATMEGQHQARAASETHRGVLMTIIRQAKRAVCRMLRNDVLRPYLRTRYGEAAEALCPTVTLGNADGDDVTALWTAAAQLARAGYFDPSQFPKLDELLNLPPRTLDPQADDTAAETAVDDDTDEEDATDAGDPADQQPAAADAGRA